MKLVLNAFRHHWNLHISTDDAPITHEQVLNAFRHHWNLHAGNRVKLVERLKCSTPFGIIGIFTLQDSSDKLSTNMCSTPFGIIGIFTHTVDKSIVGLDQCSTPFGIIGIFTQGQNRVLAKLFYVLNAFRHHWNLHISRLVSDLLPSGVLNAFRHHWNLHSGKSFVTSHPHCAQRLSASLESSRPHNALQLPARSRAQRLSASLESSPVKLRIVRPHNYFVLNAFRHHWNLHLHERGVKMIQDQVLNAFRHHWNLHQRRTKSLTCRKRAQRLSASLESSPLAGKRQTSGISECSTPFGIIGIFTRMWPDLNMP
ncbi:MAG: hypothetical protein QOJ02_924 [Acidobacteriota bacterium]|nr:hypothetical protein [Acidobacteriota bacterium]